jgi:hypothetical protein
MDPGAVELVVLVVTVEVVLLVELVDELLVVEVLVVNVLVVVVELVLVALVEVVVGRSSQRQVSTKQNFPGGQAAISMHTLIGSGGMVSKKHGSMQRHPPTPGSKAQSSSGPGHTPPHTGSPPGLVSRHKSVVGMHAQSPVSGENRQSCT